MAQHRPGRAVGLASLGGTFIAILAIATLVAATTYSQPFAAATTAVYTNTNSGGGTGSNSYAATPPTIQGDWNSYVAETTNGGYRNATIDDRATFDVVTITSGNWNPTWNTVNLTESLSGTLSVAVTCTNNGFASIIAEEYMTYNIEETQGLINTWLFQPFQMVYNSAAGAAAYVACDTTRSQSFLVNVPAQSFQLTPSFGS